MDALKAAGLCALLAASPQTHTCGQVAVISSSKIDRWQSLIEAASARFGIPIDWIRAVMARESAGLTALHGAPMVSSAGAMGLMQLMPGTWSDLRARYDLGHDPFDPRDNIFAGTAYLREMYDRYGYPALFAAYHGGPGRMNAVLAGQKPLPETTEAYLESIVPDVEPASIGSKNRPAADSKSSPDALFFVRERDGKSLSTETERLRATPSLFVPLVSQSDTSSQ